MNGSLRVRAPATSANLGPAFDTAGIALDWWDELEVRRAPVDAIHVSGEQVAVRCRPVAAQDGGVRPPLPLSVLVGFRLGDGFGSSAAAVVLGLTAARR